MAVLIPISRSRWKNSGNFSGRLDALSPTHRMVQYSRQGRNWLLAFPAVSSAHAVIKSAPARTTLKPRGFMRHRPARRINLRFAFFMSDASTRRIGASKGTIGQRLFRRTRQDLGTGNLEGISVAARRLVRSEFRGLDREGVVAKRVLQHAGHS